MSEGWTRAEARHRERWCEGKGYERGVPACDGRASKRQPVGTAQLCQACARARSTKPPTIAELQRAFDKAVAAEHRAVEAVPETPPRHAVSPAAKAAADRAWVAAAKTNAARAELTAALDKAAKP